MVQEPERWAAIRKKLEWKATVWRDRLADSIAAIALSMTSR
jgi:hypothetical protein